ncbi:MAG TPA: hypothetical protein VFA59_00580 [Vicinamibacterales bacterium]|nr:hypothetical protein [Vicinamibacterales bacterium]
MEWYGVAAFALVALTFYRIHRVVAFAAVSGAIVFAFIALRRVAPSPVRLADWLEIVIGLVGWTLGLIIVRVMLVRSVSLHLLERIDQRTGGSFIDELGVRIGELRRVRLVRVDDAKNALTPLGRSVAALLDACDRLVRHGPKLQTHIVRIVLMWGAAFVIAVIAISLITTCDIPALAMLWCGAFLAWFGIRSHIESSILLRMLSLLRHGALGDDELLDRYATRYGEDVRTAELRAGGFVTVDSDGMHVTPKARTILLLVSKLR